MGTWVITGASRGIGFHLARAARSAGEHVIGTVRTKAAGKRLASAGIAAEMLDVTDAASIRGFAKRLANTSVDVLINNAAIGGGANELRLLQTADILRFVEVNTCGALLVTRALASNIRSSHRRLVVNVSSRMGSIRGTADDEHPCAYAYRISKAALNMATQCLSREFEEVTFLLLHPGWVRTRQGGRRAPISPSVAGAALYDIVARTRRSRTASFVDATSGRRIDW